VAGSDELEHMLEMLECMVNDISTSVVVVRKIEVPRGLCVGM
jgi:hypothetical protein